MSNTLKEGDIMKRNLRQCCSCALLAGGLAFGGTSASLAQEDVCALTYDAELDPQGLNYCVTYCEVSNCDALDGTELPEETEACQALFDRIVEHTGSVPPC